MKRRLRSFVGIRPETMWRDRSDFLSGLIVLTACDNRSIPKSPTVAAADALVPQYTYEIVHTWPHDRGAFTQGLLYLDGVLYESTGLNGESSLRKVELTNGNVLKKISIPAEFFAEGLALQDGKLFQLTWQDHKCFVYDLATFEPKARVLLSG